MNDANCFEDQRLYKVVFSTAMFRVDSKKGNILRLILNQYCLKTKGLEYLSFQMFYLQEEKKIPLIEEFKINNRTFNCLKN